jgi:outer membrane biosynthesis protein TonB
VVHAALKSAGLHGLALLLAYVGVPQLLAEVPPAESVMVVDLVPIAEVRNLPSTTLPPKPERAPAPPPEPPAPPEPEPEQAALPEPEPVAPPEPEPAQLVAPEPVPDPEPEPQPVEVARLPAEITRPRKKPKPPSPLDFEKALRSLEDLEPAPAAALDPIEQVLAEVETPYRLDAPLSMTEIDSIKAQIQRNWNVPAGARDAQTMTVTLRLRLGPDGTVEHVEVVEAARMQADPFFRTMAESAVRAVLKTGRIMYLSPEKYSRWRDLKLTFNPEDMFG